MTGYKRGFLIAMGLLGMLCGVLSFAIGVYIGYGVVSDLLRETGPLGKDPLLTMLLLGLGALLLKGGVESLRRSRAG